MTQAGFARCDLLSLLIAVSLIGLTILPALAHKQNKSDRLQCLNNLRQIGQAFHLWGKDHNNGISWRTATAAGGTWELGSAKVGNLTVEFRNLSAELGSPRILACPSDTSRNRATTFDRSPSSGLFHPSFRNNAISYWINLDANTLGGGFNSPGFEFTPSHAIAGDRNVETRGFTSCSSGLSNAQLIPNSLDPNNRTADTQWTADLHNKRGNVLFNDGAALHLSTHALRTKLALSDDNGSIHILKP